MLLRVLSAAIVCVPRERCVFLSRRLIAVAGEDPAIAEIWDLTVRQIAQIHIAGSHARWPQHLELTPGAVAWHAHLRQHPSRRVADTSQMQAWWTQQICVPCRPASPCSGFSSR